MKKTVFRNDALSIMRVDSNEKLKNISDDSLVSLAQEDIDIFRYACLWKCNSCKKEILYKESLLKLDEKYIHELKCSDVIIQGVDCKKCKEQMILKHEKDLNLDSIYFDELIARYQDRMIAEAMKCRGVEDPYEVYAIIVGFFMKIVGKFAREKSFLKTSEKWFSTYFWVSIRNKTTDIRKTNNYIKRSPFISCEVCERKVGQINSRHLLEPGHEDLLDFVKYNIGLTFIKESGEISYYKKSPENDLKNRCLKIGNDFINYIEHSKRKDFVSRELYRAYCEIYPESSLKNTITSINEPVSNSNFENTEIGDSCAIDRSLFFDHSDNNDLVDLINGLVYKIISPNIGKLNTYFENNVDSSRKIDIIRSVLTDKSSYNKMSDKEIDIDYKGEVKRGLTSAIFKLISSNENVKEEIFKIQGLTV